MTEGPTPSWWAVSLAILLWAAPLPLAADRTEDPPETITASEALLPGPDLDTSLLKSHRKLGAWRQSGHYAEPASGPLLEETLLESVLTGLTLPEASAELSLWEELERWLSKYLDDQSGPVLPEWLRSLRLPEETALWVFYISCALIVLLALAIVGNEIRLARGRRKGPVAKTGAEIEAARFAESPDSEPTSLLELPAWLLSRLIARLGLRLSGARGDSLTHRELVQAGQSLPEEVTEPLGALARTAERIRYGDAVPDDLEVATAVERGTALLDALEPRR